MGFACAVNPEFEPVIADVVDTVDADPRLEICQSATTDNRWSDLWMRRERPQRSEVWFGGLGGLGVCFDRRERPVEIGGKQESLGRSKTVTNRL
jgi:hypothetical protein